jgi:hypothetical protein
LGKSKVVILEAQKVSEHMREGHRKPREVTGNQTCPNPPNLVTHLRIYLTAKLLNLETSNLLCSITEPMQVVPWKSQETKHLQTKPCETYSPNLVTLLRIYLTAKLLNLETSNLVCSITEPMQIVPGKSQETNPVQTKP